MGVCGAAVGSMRSEAIERTATWWNFMVVLLALVGLVVTTRDSELEWGFVTRIFLGSSLAIGDWESL